MKTTTSLHTAAAALASFCASVRWPELSPPVQERTKELILDLLGVAVRGSAESSSGPPAALTHTIKPPGKASVIGAGFTTAPVWAALANGKAAHAIEMDDVTSESSLHPSVAVIPAALAMAEEQESTPIEFLEAVVVGYEITMRVGNALNPASAYQRGFHPTGVAGVFGATTAAGHLIGLNTEQLVQALGIAGTMAAGSLEYLSDGSWTKRLNPGWAAHSGIVAAALAAEGFTGPSTVFDGPLGLFKGYTDKSVSHRLLDALGEPFQIMLVSIKPYACCRYNHGLIDCMLALKQEYNIRSSEVEAIHLGVPSAGELLVASPIEQKRAPINVVDAQFSAPFAAAVTLVHRAAGLAEYSQTNVDDPVIRSLMARTDCYQDASLDAVYPKCWPASAEIKLRDGRTISRRIEYPTGEPDNPVSREALVQKFTSLVDNLLTVEEAHKLVGRILNLDKETWVRDVMTVLSKF